MIFDHEEMKFITQIVIDYYSDNGDESVEGDVLSKLEELTNNMFSTKVYKVLYTYKGEYKVSTGFYSTLVEFDEYCKDSENIAIELLKSTMIDQSPKDTKYLVTPIL